MQTRANIEIFVNNWVARNVHAMPHQANLLQELDRLAAGLTGDARANGISGRELNRALGDIDDYLAGRIDAAGELPAV